jgi:hypothetical protein
VTLGLDLGPRRIELAVDIGEPAALGEAAGCTGRRVRACGEAVPAPEIALARDEPLTGLEQRHQPRSVVARNDSDLLEPARQLGRRLDVVRQRLDAIRQGGIGRIDRDAGPAHRR